MQQVNERQTANALGVSPPQPTETQLQIWSQFESYCQRVGLRTFPSAPASVAAYLQAVPDEALWPICDAIVAIHDRFGQSNPVGTHMVRVILERRLRTECPRSWDREARELF